MRNTFFAWHGRIFQSPELDSYFRSQHWYRPRQDFSEDELTEVQRENIRRVLEYEEWLKEFLEEK